MQFLASAGRSSGLAGLVAAAVLALMVAGCSSVEPTGAGTAPVGGDCSAQGAQWAVGKMSTAKVVEEARVRAGARMARVLRPGQAITKEFNFQRLNLDVDATGVVVGVRCG
ncbi:I78 family peptidase inhibitor [Diaphorobacter sp.]|uniref:I78 family peptidase inhibitor n=1 Tax=Diaphorobacter sp. TaxID=1934310 RepID=UPI003D0E4430